MMSNSTDFSASVSEAVGSSKITTFASTVSARAISTICWLAMDRSPTRALGPNPHFSRSRIAPDFA